MSNILVKKSNEISPALRKAIEEGTSYNEWDMIPNKKYQDSCLN